MEYYIDGLNIAIESIVGKKKKKVYQHFLVEVVQIYLQTILQNKSLN